MRLCMVTVNSIDSWFFSTRMNVTTLLTVWQKTDMPNWKKLIVRFVRHDCMLYRYSPRCFWAWVCATQEGSRNILLKQCSDITISTLLPRSWAMPSARAVFPVPGAPASRSARPAIFFCRIISTTRPAASRACSWPTNPDPTSSAVPSSCTPQPRVHWFHTFSKQH